ncbi:acyl carrier protein [Candidatus Thorarchaeota archaeon]|nr:MAG: acyl carrier protein [Candidatus Thorarchaeota archaeon]
MTDFDNKLLDILSRVFRIDQGEITDNLKRKDFEPWDSMAHLMLISEIENEFEIFFEDEEVVDIWTVGDLKKILNQKMSP